MVYVTKLILDLPQVITKRITNVHTNKFYCLSSIFSLKFETCHSLDYSLTWNITICFIEHFPYLFFGALSTAPPSLNSISCAQYLPIWHRYLHKILSMTFISNQFWVLLASVPVLVSFFIIISTLLFLFQILCLWS